MSRSLSGRLLTVAIVFALVFYFLFLVITKIPATLFTANLVRFVPQLQLAVISGTAWNGQAGDAVINIEGQAIRLGQLKWHFKPAALFVLKACVELESEVVSGGFCRSLVGANYLNKVQLDLPASLANRITTEAQFAGQASLNIAEAVVSDKGMVSKLAGNLTWKSATISVEGSSFALGDFAADLSAADNGAIAASIFDLSGPFGIKLDALVGAATPPSVNGEITPRDNAPEEILDVLGLVAVPQDNGAFKVVYPMGS